MIKVNLTEYPIYSEDQNQHVNYWIQMHLSYAIGKCTVPEYVEVQLNMRSCPVWLGSSLFTNNIFWKL